MARISILLGAGFSEREIRNAVATGEIGRIRHGVVALPGAAPDFVAAVLGNGLLTCASATVHHAIWRLHAPARVHLLCRHGATKGAVIHRGSVVPPDSPWPVAGLTDILLHALRCLPALEAAVLVESAVLQGRTKLRRWGNSAATQREPDAEGKVP